jgi:signal transduction histidine kinase
MIPGSLLVLAAVVLTLGLWVFFSRPENHINRLFAIFTFAISGWALAIGLLHTGSAVEFWSRLAFVTSGFIPTAFLAFARVFPLESRWPPRAVVISLLSIAIVFALLALSTPWLISDAILSETGFTRRSGPLYPLFVLYFLGTWITAFSVFVHKWRHARGQPRAQLQYLAIGILISFAGGIATNLLAPFLLKRTSYTWMGPYFTLPLVAAVGHAIIRSRLLDLRLIAHRSTSFVVAVAGISAITFLVSHIWFDLRFTESISVPFVPVIVIAVGLVLLSAPVAPSLMKLVDRYFLKGRVDHDRVIVEATRRLQRVIDANALVQELRRVLLDALAPERLVFLEKANTRDSWLRVSSDDIAAESSELSMIYDAGWRLNPNLPSVQLVETIATESSLASDKRQAELLRSAGFDLWVGLGRGSDKQFVILLGPRRSGEPYLSNHFAFLDSLADIGTLAAEIIDLHRRQLNLERDRQRDAHLARMAKLYAGLAHEIRTPLTTLSNLISMLPDRLDDHDYRDLLMNLVPSEISRIASLAEKLRAMAPGSPVSYPVDLKALLEKVVALQRTRLNGKRISIHLDIDEDPPHIAGDHDRLVQLFTNLIQNAVDATVDTGDIHVRATAQDSSVIVEIMDSGTGLAPELHERLFEPFLTTKSSGMGLGLSICREIAEAHRAKLILEDRKDQLGVRAEVTFPSMRVAESLTLSTAGTAT